MEQVKFQYYPANIFQTYPIGYVSLEQFINGHREPKEETKELFSQISYYETTGDKQAKAKIKEQLYSFTPCVHIQGKRKYESITRFTGLLVLDFDHIDNAPDFKDYLFSEYKSAIAAWLSPSKHGVKALVKIPTVKSIQEFKSYYYGVGNRMWEYNGFDGSGQNCVLPLFQSFDPDILVRDNPQTWTVKGRKFNEMSTDSTISPQPIQPNDNYERIILKIIDTGIDKIIDNGHPQLRSLCLAVGGYAANGYISYQSAVQHLRDKIASNGYLRKNIRGYQSTAEWAMTQGTRRPLHLMKEI